MNKILIVAAHPDDEILGCGGTVARMITEGNAVAATLILGEGVTARDSNRDRSSRKNKIISLKQNIAESNKIIGIEKSFGFDFPDNRFDSVSLLDIVKKKEVYAFEVLSSTEWNFPLSFSPDFFVDVSSTLPKKQLAMVVYKNELREFPHPRSLDGIDLNAKYWGMRTGLGLCEAFKTLRRVWK